MLGRKLSLGQRMRADLAAALLHAPPVVYLDEPTIGLDITAQRAMREFILAYRSEHRPAMILTSHYMEDIERLCERIVVIREGAVVYDGALRDVVERFARHTVVTARLGPNGGAVCADPTLEALGRVVECTDALVRLQVPRGEVAGAAGALLERYPVADLSIE